VIKVVVAMHDSTGFYWMYLATALSSMCTYSTKELSIVVLHDETLSKHVMRRIEDISRSSSRFNVEVQFIHVELPQRLSKLNLKNFTKASLYRLLIPKLFPDEAIVLYCDADLIFNGVDISQLKNFCRSGSKLYGVLDPYIDMHKITNDLERMNLNAASYINSGVLIFRPNLIEVDLMEKFQEFADRFGSASHPDQDFINYEFKGKIEIIDKKFNYFIGVHDRALIKPLSYYDDKILHYAGKIKPLDGVMAPGFIPFWRHTALVPELNRHPSSTTLPRYLFPVQGQAHAVKRVTIADQPPPQATN
jgi:lipopolysaccharide biosynthesis glycosyltransferase